jgi:tRNA 2-thiouridine synthesizing protein E
MTTTTIEGHTLHVDQEGFLTDLGEWDEEVADALARQIGLTLGPEHWTVLRYLREEYGRSGESPTLRRVSKALTMPVQDLFALFPGKPAKKMAYVAGLPKPRGCV